MKYAFVWVLIIGLLLSPFIIFGLAVRSTAHMETLTVKEKGQRIQNTQGTNKYAQLIYADNGVYRNTDSIWMGKFNSSDIYSQLDVGKTYECKVAGWRFGFLGWYKNLIKCRQK